MSDPVSDKSRFFILTVGRTGSTLLCAALADAGADFGMPVPAQWDPKGGALEHPHIIAAARHYRRAFEIDSGRNFVMWPKFEATVRRATGRRRLTQALAAARFVKIGDLDLVIQPAFTLGYRPQLILSYRRFEPTATSLVVGRKHSGPDSLAADYCRLYRQGLMLVFCFGGCVVSFDELNDPTASSWPSRLAEFTGLSAEKLAGAAAGRRGAPSPARDFPVLYPEAERIYQQLEQLRGQVISPSPQTERKATSH